MPPRSETADAFRSIILHTSDNLFEELLASARFEAVGKGRLGAVLVKLDETGRIPIVRTTTRYSLPAQRFRPVHAQLAQQIQEGTSIAVGFNNALLESYTSAYTTMGSHSDQALDLCDDSAIALFSCYRYPELATPPRKLVVESKAPGGGPFELQLTHNSVVVFSTGANRRFRHKIILDAPPQAPENPWLGITFRTSKTFVQLRGGGTYLPDDTPLTLADGEQRREFYQLRRRENEEAGFIYPRITYTISESDLRPPEP